MEFMQKAIEEANFGAEKGDGGPFGAVIVRDNEIIATGHNMVLATNDPTAHGEVVAIRNACAKLGSFSLEGCILYTSCYPCPMCLSSSLWARLDTVFYAATEDQAADAGFSDKEFNNFIKNREGSQLIKLRHLEASNSLEPFLRWKEMTDKTMY